MNAVPASSEPHVMPTYGRLPIALSHGQGVWVWDTEGRRFLDGLGGINEAHGAAAGDDALKRFVLLAGGAYLWNLTASGYANTYYAAAAQAADVVRVADAAVVASALISSLAASLDSDGRASSNTVRVVLDQVRDLAAAVRGVRR